MAVAEHSVSRRALLGAALALPAATRAGSLVVPSASDPEALDRSGRWRRALSAFEQARSALDAAAGDPDEVRFDRALGAFSATLRGLIRTPAPGLPALALKIELVVDHDLPSLSGAASCLAALKRDARRLAGKPG